MTRWKYLCAALMLAASVAGANASTVFDISGTFATDPGISLAGTFTVSPNDPFSPFSISSLDISVTGISQHFLTDGFFGSNFPSPGFLVVAETPTGPVAALFMGALSGDFSGGVISSGTVLTCDTGCANLTPYADGFTGTFTPEVSTTPLPAALPLFASGLGTLGLLGWRRKRKTCGSTI